MVVDCVSGLAAGTSGPDERLVDVTVTRFVRVMVEVETESTGLCFGAFGMAAMFHEPGGHIQAQLHVSDAGLASCGWAAAVAAEAHGELLLLYSDHDEGSAASTALTLEVAAHLDVLSSAFGDASTTGVDVDVDVSYRWYYD